MLRRGFPARVVVAVFLHRYRWGYQIRGDERGFIEKAKRYKIRGIRLLAIEEAPSLQSDMREPAYESIGIGNDVMPAHNPARLLRLLMFTLIRIRGRLPRHPLAIYAYNQDVENLVLGLLLKLASGAPLVVVYHQVDGSQFQPFPEGYVTRRSEGYGRLSALWRSILPAIAWYSVHKADINLALSEATRLEVQDILRIRNCEFVGNGVDSRKFRPLDVSKAYEACFLGRLAPQKGVDIILEAWKMVSFWNPAARLALIGGGERENVEKYNRMIDDLGIKKNVDLRGFLSDSEVVNLLNSSKLFVFPSRREGFAQAVSQAMACGCCCIISDIPSLRENYSEAAVLVPPESPVALGQEIIRLLKDETSRQEMQVRARRHALRFSWEDVVERELSQITSFCSQAPHGSTGAPQAQCEDGFAG
jgi:glycosyltransferase involved in cell wall biosynthesis